MEIIIPRVLLFFVILLGIACKVTYDFKNKRGTSRVLFGEFYRDIGLAILVGTAFKYTPAELSYWILVIVSASVMGIGARMKYKV